MLRFDGFGFLTSTGPGHCEPRVLNRHSIVFIGWPYGRQDAGKTVNSIISEPTWAGCDSTPTRFRTKDWPFTSPSG